MNAQAQPKVRANIMALAESEKDIRSPMGMCELMSTKLQLIPLRYGLVERLDPSSALDIPLKLSSHPIGIRLLRDGYLYIIDSASGYLHEYQIEKGQITKLLWKDHEVAADVRTASVGEPHLVFKRQSTLYACYSEIQWTAFKCSQVLKDNSERERLMQRIEPSTACPSKGGPHLLSQPQAEQWLAEVAESTSPTEPAPTLPEGTNPEERQPYSWEAEPLFYETGIQTLTSQVLGPYKNDFLFLVLRDDFGVMRDLANEQLKIGEWIEHWSADEEAQRKYLTGSYIQSLYQVSASSLGAQSAVDPDIKALKDETTPEQQTALYDYLKARSDYRGPEIYGPEEAWRKAAKYLPHGQAWLTLHDALGEEKWQRHEQTIRTLSLKVWESLHGSAIGEAGIDDLIHRLPMQDFVTREQTLLTHWHARLERVREDRLQMIIGGYFHRAAWYYDFELDTQIKHRLETEFLCVAAVCGNRESAEKLAAYLEQNLLTLIPGLDSLHQIDQLEIAKKLADLSNFSIKVLDVGDSLGNVTTLSNQFNSLMAERLPNYAALNTRFQGLQSMIDGAYDPAKQLKLSDQLDKAQRAFQLNQHIDPNIFIREAGSSVRIQLLRDFALNGLNVRGATPAEIQVYNQTRDTAIRHRAQLKSLYQERKKSLSNQLYGLEPAGSEAPYNRAITQLHTALAPLEDRLLMSLTVGSGSPGQIGTVVDGWSAQMREELSRSVRDFRATGTFTAPVRSVLSSKGDLLALTLVVLQAIKFIEVLGELKAQKNKSLASALPFFEAIVGLAAVSLAATQGLAVTVFQAHIQRMESVAGKLNSMSRLGRWVGTAGLGAYGFGAVSALIDFNRHAQQWGEAITTGNHKALLATSMQLTGDAILVGTNAWAYKHTHQIVTQIVITPSELRALAWAQASPRLLSIAVKANLVGLIGTALQLAGEGLYNYFHRDAMQKWVEESAWGTNNLQRSLQDDWSALARVVQQPTCVLVRDAKGTYLRFVLPGIRTRELDSRQLQLLVYQCQRDDTSAAHYNPRHPTRWHARSAAWAGTAKVASQEDDALVLHLPIPDFLQTSDFKLALNIGYQLEAERELMHRTCFLVQDLRSYNVQGYRVPLLGTFKINAVATLPDTLETAKPWLIQRDELGRADV